MAEHGAAIVVNARTAGKVEKAAAALAAAGHKVHGAVFDVTDYASVEAEVDRIEKDVGPIAILVNNAGIQFRAPLEDFPEDKWQQLLQTNVSGVFNVGKAVARKMIPRGRGKIINIASVQSELARPNIAPYTATKGAVRNLTKGMCTDWAKHGLQVNAIAPGFFRTPAQQGALRRSGLHGLAREAHAGQALGRSRGTGRRGSLPRIRRLVLRQRPHALRRWRDNRLAVTTAWRGSSRLIRASMRSRLQIPEITTAGWCGRGAHAGRSV